MWMPSHVGIIVSVESPDSWSLSLNYFILFPSKMLFSDILLHYKLLWNYIWQNIWISLPQKLCCLLWKYFVNNFLLSVVLASFFLSKRLIITYFRLHLGHSLIPSHYLHCAFFILKSSFVTSIIYLLCLSFSIA